METKGKGAETISEGFSQLMVSMKCTKTADFDVAAVYETKKEQLSLVYFGDLGSLNSFPFIQLISIDSIAHANGENTETIRITKLDDMNYVWIVCWDYEKLQTGLPAIFHDTDISLTIIDDKGSIHKINLDTRKIGNVAVVAMIDNSNPSGAKLINSNKIGMLKGLNNLRQLIDIIKS